MKATLSNYRQPPRKVRLLADYLRGKKVTDALVELKFVSKKASGPIAKLINSAVANAKNNFKKESDDLYIKTIKIDKGVVMRRFMPRARGRATPLRHRTSHINIELDEVVSNPVAVETKKVAKVTKAK